MLNEQTITTLNALKLFGCVFRSKVGQGSGLNWATLTEQSGPPLS